MTKVAVYYHYTSSIAYPFLCTAPKHNLVSESKPRAPRLHLFVEVAKEAPLGGFPILYLGILECSKVRFVGQGRSESGSIGPSKARREMNS